MMTVGRVGARRKRRTASSICAGVMFTVPFRRWSTARRLSSVIARTDTEYPMTLSAMTLFLRSKMMPRGAGTGTSRRRFVFDCTSYFAWFNTWLLKKPPIRNSNTPETSTLATRPRLTIAFG